ncbi:MAG: NADH:flavin oxidoreductase [Halanaerobiaceae bacterium]
MPDLLTPLTIKNLKLSNRIVMPPMANGLADEKGKVKADLIDHYTGRPDTGLIIVEHSYIRPEGKAGENQLGIYSDELIEGLQELVKAVHEENNKIGIQINHAGSTASREVIGESPVAPSPVKHPGRDEAELPRELTKSEMEAIKDSFVAAALRAKKAGFDMVEVHGAHGYFLNQFFSPLTNQRDDEYGGSFAGRLKYPLEVVKAVRQAVGEDYPLFYRMGCDDFLPGGLTAEDGVKAAPELSRTGVDVIDLTGGLKGFRPVDEKEEGFRYLARAVKPATDAYILVTGGIKQPETADEIIQKEEADLVGIGRAFLKDKLWARKAVEQLSNE